MSSIPLPALYLQPPKFQDSADTVGRLVQMKGMLQNQQMQQQEMQLRSQQIKDQQATTAAMRNWDGKDYDALAKGVLENGGSATAATQIQQHGLNIQKTLSDMAKQDAETGSKQLETFIGKHKAVGDTLQGIESVPDDQLHNAATQAVNSLTKAGVMDQAGSQQAMQIIQNTPDPQALRQHIDMVAKSSMGAKAAAEQAKTEAETQQAQARTGEAQATTAKTQLETDLMKQYGTPQQQEAKYISLQTRKNQGVPVLPAEAAFMKAYEHNKTLVPVANFNLQNAGVGTTGQPSAMAQAVANGQMKWQDVISPRTPMSVKNQFAQEVKAINPNFNSGDFQVEQKVKEEFTSGDAAKNLTAFNTAIEHANQLQGAADALQNGDTRALNQIGNTLGYQFGSDKTTNFNVIKNALSGEISKVFKGGQATDAEIREVQEPFNAANSPAQLKGAIQNAITLMNSKRDALQKQYQSGVTGKPNFGSQGGGQHVAGGQAHGLTEGQTGTGSDGKKYVVKGGVWTPQ